jgi:hypothetical protein
MAPYTQTKLNSWKCLIRSSQLFSCRAQFSPVLPLIKADSRYAKYVSQTKLSSSKTSSLKPFFHSSLKLQLQSNRVPFGATSWFTLRMGSWRVCLHCLKPIKVRTKCAWKSAKYLSYHLTSAAVLPQGCTKWFSVTTDSLSLNASKFLWKMLQMSSKKFKML